MDDGMPHLHLVNHPHLVQPSFMFNHKLSELIKPQSSTIVESLIIVSLKYNPLKILT